MTTKSCVDRCKYVCGGERFKTESDLISWESGRKYTF